MKKLLTIPFLFFVFFACAKTIVVGSSQPVKSLKQAISMANNKDTILFKTVSYKEGTSFLQNR